MRSRLFAVFGLTVILAGVLAFAVGSPRFERAAAQAAATPAVATGPDWKFVVYELQDPYAGTLIVPAPKNIDPAMRYIGIDAGVEAGTFSVQVKAANVRLRDSDGREYSTGRTTGSEVKLADREVLPGETDRGWLWFEVPTGARIVQIVFIPGTVPEYRLPYDAAPLSSATPATPSPTVASTVAPVTHTSTAVAKKPATASATPKP